jgi:hypothetical protein
VHKDILVHKCILGPFIIGSTEEGRGGGGFRKNNSSRHVLFFFAKWAAVDPVMKGLECICAPGCLCNRYVADLKEVTSLITFPAGLARGVTVQSVRGICGTLVASCTI